MNAKAKHVLLVIVASGMLLTACNGGDEEATEEESPRATPTEEAATTTSATPTTGATPTAGATAQGQGQGQQMRVTLEGKNEVPAGDPDMQGNGTVRLDPTTGQVCPDINILKPEATAIRAAHIHRGAAGANGPIVVPFESDANGIKDDCVTADQALVNEIVQNPGSFYVNVHTERFPNGAIRGQLSR